MKITVIMKAAIGQVLKGWDAFLKAFCPQSEYSDSRRLQDDSGNEPPIALSAASPILEPHLLPECWGTC
ncbi:hypothetical protein [Sinorhizobium medicae]|uniref:hypothetical protein n=1 Tax=Sinorhizobium medicae TaxID=110321 RepID=UPI001F1823F7|nr:hypothetical protein [Sinorhizobium medicae]